ncbi:MAG: thioredoxin family protein, partial [Planctomycetales bacterium]
MKQSHFIRLGALVALMGMSGCGVEPLPESASIPESQQVVAGTEDTHQETPAETPDMIDGMAFVDGYAEGFRIAQEEGKPMLLFFTAEWCRYCHLMLEDAFVQEEVVSLSKRFVCVWVDADRETEVCETFEVDGYPTVQFLSPRGTVLNRVVGKRGAAEFLPEMQAALQAVAQHADDNDPVR